MPTYECDNCNISTKLKGDFNRHLKTQKHINKLKAISDKILKKTIIDSQMTHKDSQMTHKDSQMTHKDSQMTITFKCDHCLKIFTRRNNLVRHVKRFCKIANNKNEVDTKYKDEFEKMHKQIEMLMDEKQKCSNINTNTNNTNNNNTFNIDKQIILNNYGNEDMSHITNNFKDSLLNIPFSAISKMIEKVHFNKKKPQNKNIKLPNKKDNLIKVFQDDKWIFKDKKSTITNLVDTKYNIIDDHYEEKIEANPQYVNKGYSKFQKLYDDNDDDLHNQVSIDCELILLNNR